MDVRSRSWSARDLVLPVVLATLCLAPHLARLRHPSLFYDDLDRVAEVQNSPLPAMLIRAVNEHIAPFFQSVTWVTWQCAGHRLANAPLAFTLASYLPFLLVLGLVHRVAGRELGSAAAGWVAVVAFSLTFRHAEAVNWYSASSFMWAVMWMLAAWLGAIAIAEGRVWPGGLVAVAAAALAPACSLIGLMAGPLAAMRVLTAPRAGRRGAGAILPLVGTVLFLALYVAVVRHTHSQVGATIRQELVLGWPLWNAVSRAVAGALVPGLFGIRYLHARGWALHLLALAGLAGVLAGALRSRHRPLILGGLGMIVGGYVLTFAPRVNLGSETLLVPRYHLVPQLGLSLLLATAAHPWLSRIAQQPGRVASTMVAMAGAMIALNGPMLAEQARQYDYPDQARTLAALDHLARICQVNGVTRAQALGAFNGFRPPWAYADVRTQGVNPLAMLPEMACSSRLTDTEARRAVWAALSPAERDLLSVGLVVSRSLVPVGAIDPSDTVVVGRLVRCSRIREAEPGLFRTVGMPSFLEYEMIPSPVPAKYLLVPGTWPGDVGEVWWSEGENWQPSRSLVWFADTSRPGRSWAVRLADIPGWDAARVRAVRVVFRLRGMAQLEQPRLLR